MRSYFSTAIFGVCLCWGLGLMSQPFQSRSETTKLQAEEEKPGKVLRHVVLFKFKKEVTKAEIKEVTDAFSALPKKIKQITDFEWGTDVSVENKAAGFTHGFVVSFASTKSRDEYLPHPAHKEFVKLVGPRLEDVLVFDFWARK